MDPLYYKSFQAFTALAATDPRVGRVLRFVDDIVPTVLSAPYTLRDDGRLFLGLNLTWLVALPWEDVNVGQSFLTRYAGQLRADLTLILQDASSAAAKQGQTELSSHMVLDAVAGMYSRLNVLGLNIWG